MNFKLSVAGADRRGAACASATAREPEESMSRFLAVIPRKTVSTVRQSSGAWTMGRVQERHIHAAREEGSSVPDGGSESSARSSVRAAGLSTSALRRLRATAHRRVRRL